MIFQINQMFHKYSFGVILMFTLFEIEMLCACLPVMQIDAAPYALATSSEQRPIGPAGLREI